MSRKLRDVIPAATSQLLPQAASRQVVMRNIEVTRARSKANYDKRASGQLKPFTPGGKSVREATSYKQVVAMDVWGGS